MTTASMTLTAQPKTPTRPGGTTHAVGAAAEALGDAPVGTPGDTRVGTPGDTPVRTVQLRVGDGDDTWFSVCPVALLTPGRGVAVLLPDSRQAALFQDRSGRLYAIDNRDPFTGASVLSRGLLGSVAGTPFVASPLLKQRFTLTDGRCMDDDAASVVVFDVRVAHGGPDGRGTRSG